MNLVIDTNRLLAAILRDSTTRKIIYSKKLRFVVPEHATAETLKYKRYIEEKAGLTDEEFTTIFSQILFYVDIIPKSMLQPYMDKADYLMKDMDLSDSPFVACALATKSDGIFSEDKHFEKQDKIKVWKTKDLLKFTQK